MTTWATPPFTIGGISVDLPQAAGLTTNRPAPADGFTDIRLGSGSPVRQTRWTRFKGSISFDGFLPVALSTLDWTRPVEVQWPQYPYPTITAFVKISESWDRTKGTFQYQIEIDEV